MENYFQKHPHPELAEAAHHAGADGVCVYKFFHGTSFKNAQKIQQEGFIKSPAGLLGPGVYVAREEKARSFATLSHSLGNDGRLFGRLGPEHDQGG